MGEGADFCLVGGGAVAAPGDFGGLLEWLGELALALALALVLVVDRLLDGFLLLVLSREDTDEVDLFFGLEEEEEEEVLDADDEPLVVRVELWI